MGSLGKKLPATISALAPAAAPSSTLQQQQQQQQQAPTAPPAERPPPPAAAGSNVTASAPAAALPEPQPALAPEPLVGGSGAPAAPPLPPPQQQQEQQQQQVGAAAPSLPPPGPPPAAGGGGDAFSDDFTPLGVEYSPGASPLCSPAAEGLGGSSPQPATVAAQCPPVSQSVSARQLVAQAPAPAPAVAAGQEAAGQQAAAGGAGQLALGLLGLSAAAVGALPRSVTPPPPPPASVPHGGPAAPVLPSALLFEGGWEPPSPLHASLWEPASPLHTSGVEDAGALDVQSMQDQLHAQAQQEEQAQQALAQQVLAQQEAQPLLQQAQPSPPPPPQHAQQPAWKADQQQPSGEEAPPPSAPQSRREPPGAAAASAPRVQLAFGSAPRPAPPKSLGAVFDRSSSEEEGWGPRGQEKGASVPRHGAAEEALPSGAAAAPSAAAAPALGAAAAAAAVAPAAAAAAAPAALPGAGGGLLWHGSLVGCGATEDVPASGRWFVPATCTAQQVAALPSMLPDGSRWAHPGGRPPAAHGNSDLAALRWFRSLGHASSSKEHTHPEPLPFLAALSRLVLSEERCAWDLDELLRQRWALGPFCHIGPGGGQAGAATGGGSGWDWLHMVFEVGRAAK